jgi:hypothetical protein
VGAKRTCRLTPGDRFASKKAASDAEFQRKLNNGTNGQRVQVSYKVVSCRCNGWHLTTVSQDRSSP